MTLHHNLIAGEWVGSNGVENINPSNTRKIVGLMPAPALTMPRLQSLLQRPRFRPGLVPAFLSVTRS